MRELPSQHLSVGNVQTTNIEPVLDLFFVVDVQNIITEKLRKKEE